jgi:hypothetical protein
LEADAQEVVAVAGAESVRISIAALLALLATARIFTGT